MSTLIAIPSCLPGGLEAPMGMHFGKCEIYTLVEADGDSVLSVTTMPAIPHGQGGCLAPVQALAARGVKVLLAGGMGMRPLMGFTEAGIAVYFTGPCALVGDAVQAYLANLLPRFTPDISCGCHHH